MSERARRSGIPSVPVLMWRGVRKRCPRCGQGHLFRRWFDLPERCPRCELPFERGEGYWLGAMAINLGITEALFGIFILVAALVTWPDVPWVLLTVTGLALNAILPLVFYPYSKTIFIAIDLVIHRSDPWRARDKASWD